MENNNREIIISAKNLLINAYKYPEEHVIIDYPVFLKDGSTFKADLVVTKEPSVPYLIVFVTSDTIPVEQVKIILAQSSLQYGTVYQIKEGAYPEFWGIVKKTNILTGKLEFENISDYPNPHKFANVNFIVDAIQSIMCLITKTF
ncbi:type I restriction enzyme HsdR N-terminal domain-containing protein [Desulfosporosinus sp.]|uniref:type I restriction enzyme HsdR N-terminal domain-containing protein n=1 Tax=Desulfosporosinus sp. TaxID=157907 RepID=UPI00230B4CB5|nr:type I restriction enzyme HsdR N-terminal domain-containing protein [Desulfosporosinus sp.]MCO5385217.1 type I restriction enzyme HsdR N-terminal domain-containing protein [Desulfosporosinus sp.]MDA8222918.1 type I restriction enzyme HsdR N-terminal domain-containing protein [Desulfitobacterium hafniense]